MSNLSSSAGLKERRLLHVVASSFGSSVSALRSRDRDLNRQVVEQATTNKQIQRDQRQLVADINLANQTDDRTSNDFDLAGRRSLPGTTATYVMQQKQGSDGSVTPVGQPGTLQVQDRSKPTVKPIGQPKMGVIESTRILRQAGLNPDGTPRMLIDPVTGQQTTPAPVATPQQIAENASTLQGVMNPGFGVSLEKRARALQLEKEIQALDPNNVTPHVFSNLGDSETPEQTAARRAAVATERAAKVSELTALKQQDQGTSVTPPTEAIPSSAPEATTTPETPTKEKGSESVSDTGLTIPFDPLKPVESLFAEAALRALNVRNQTKSEIGEPDEGQLAIDLAKEKSDFLSRLDTIDELDDVKRERAEEKNRAKLAENERMRLWTEVENNEIIWNQMQDNEEAEVRARRRINKLSGGHDMSGLKYVQTEIARGKMAVSTMKQKALLMQQKYSDEAVSYINDYYLDLKQADADKKNEYDLAYKDYKTSVKDIKSDFSLDASKRRELKAKADETYSKTLTDLDLAQGDKMATMRMKLLDRVFEVEDNQRQDMKDAFNDGIQLMNLLRNKEIQSTPKTIEYAESLLGLPKGSLAIIHKVAGNGTGVAGYTSDEVREAAIAYFQTHNTLPGKAEMGTMVDVYFKNKRLISGGMSTPAGERPDVYSNPFTELQTAQELTSGIIEYNRSVSDGSFNGTFYDWKKQTASPLFGIGGGGDFSESLSAPTGSSMPGVTSFSGPR